MDGTRVSNRIRSHLPATMIIHAYSDGAEAVSQAIVIQRTAGSGAISGPTSRAGRPVGHVRRHYCSHVVGVRVSVPRRRSAGAGLGGSRWARRERRTRRGLRSALANPRRAEAGATGALPAAARDRRRSASLGRDRAPVQMTWTWLRLTENVHQVQSPEQLSGWHRVIRARALRQIPALDTEHGLGAQSAH